MCKKAKATPDSLRLEVFKPPIRGSLSGTGIQLRDAFTHGVRFIAAWNGRMEREGLQIANSITAAVNSHDAAFDLARAVLRGWAEALSQIQRDRLITVELAEPECVYLARKFLDLAGEGV